jgi:hypothetical protein
MVTEGVNELSVAREAQPIRAAERRKTLATGASLWFFEKK